MPARLGLVGPTATGKSELAVALARLCPLVELVSVDAIAVYRGLDIGTAKPTSAERAAVPWHLVDLVEPDEEFSLKAFQLAAREATNAIAARHHDIVLVGGTGLYHRSIVDELDIPGRFPEVLTRLEAEADTENGLSRLYEQLVAIDPLAASRLAATNRRRLLRALEVTLGEGRPFSSFGPGLTVYAPSAYRLIGLTLRREELDRRIAARITQQLEMGFVEEVEELLRAPRPLSRTVRQAIGYRELITYLEGRVTLEEATGEILRRSKAFARRQESWFRRDPRIEWIDALSPDALERVVTILADENERLAVRE